MAPVAYVFAGGKAYVLERERNTVLCIGGFDDLAHGLCLESAARIEPDDSQSYYMVRQMYPGPGGGFVICSYVHSKKTNTHEGYRFSFYRDFNSAPQDIFKVVFGKDLKFFPEFKYCFDRDGNHYFVNNYPGRKNIFKLPASAAGAVMEGMDLPPEVAEMGEQNTDKSSWMSAAIGQDGRIYVSSALSGKVVEYSQDGRPSREIGTVGFGEDDILSPSDIFFVAMPGSKSSLLTVASAGSRSWVQFDSEGRPAASFRPLAEGYPYQDILVKRLFEGCGACALAFDLANRAAVKYDGRYSVFPSFHEAHPFRFAMLVAGSLLLSLFLCCGEGCYRKMAGLRIPFFFKLLLVIIPVLVVGSLLIVGTFAKILNSELKAEWERRSANIAVAVVRSVSVEDLEQLRNPEDRDSKLYEIIYKKVDNIAGKTDVEFTPKWIIHKISGSKYFFGVNIWKGPLFEPFIVPRDRDMFIKVLKEKKPQFGSFIDDQGEWYSYLHPIQNKNGVVVNVLELYRPTEMLDRVVHRLEKKVWITILSISAVGALILLAFSFFFTYPLRKLIAGTKTLSTGNFDCQIKLATNDEMGDLAKAFNTMAVDLKNFTRDLAETTARKEKIESELRIAHDIQMSIVPHTFPPFPERQEFDIYAVLYPAREVGGDLYDFFFIDKDHLCFAVGDVADKGVPASLFMAVTRTLLRAKASYPDDPGRVITQMNTELSIDNTTVMFVTFLFVILDVATGEICFCNAGHNPMFVRRKGGTVEKVGKIHGMPLGVAALAGYGFDRLLLAPGDSVILYTDGVTEALGDNWELFGDKRLTDSISQTAGLSAEETVKRIHSDVGAFIKDNEPSDDITILALRYHGAAER